LGFIKSDAYLIVFIIGFDGMNSRQLLYTVFDSQLASGAVHAPDSKFLAVKIQNNLSAELKNLKININKEAWNFRIALMTN
jgi:hypothetical protein